MIVERERQERDKRSDKKKDVTRQREGESTFLLNLPASLSAITIHSLPSLPPPLLSPLLFGDLQFIQSSSVVIQLIANLNRFCNIHRLTSIHTIVNNHL